MKIVICGLGYVGATIAACLLRDGHSIAGIDPDTRKVDDVASGRSPVSEPGIGALLGGGVAAGRLAASTSLGSHLVDAPLVFICVGTPSNAAGGLDLSQIGAVLQELGAAIASLPVDAPPPLIVLRSTVPPRTMDDVVIHGPGRCRGGKAYRLDFSRISPG